MVNCWSSFNSGAFSSVVAGLFLFIASLLYVLTYSGATTGMSVSEIEPYLKNGIINVTQLRTTWNWRRASFSSLLAASFFQALGLLFLVHAAWILKKVHKSYEGNAPKLMASTFAIGAAFPALEFLQNLGGNTMANFLSTFQLDNDSLIALELSYLINNGSSIWVSAMMYVFLSISFFIVTFLTFTEAKFNCFFGVVAMFNAILAIVVFALHILSFTAPGTLLTYGIILLFWEGLGIPLWLISLAFGLRRESRKPHFGRHKEEIKKEETKKEEIKKEEIEMKEETEMKEVSE